MKLQPKTEPGEGRGREARPTPAPANPGQRRPQPWHTSGVPPATSVRRKEERERAESGEKKGKKERKQPTTQATGAPPELAFDSRRSTVDPVHPTASYGEEGKREVWLERERPTREREKKGATADCHGTSDHPAPPIPATYTCPNPPETISEQCC